MKGERMRPKVIINAGDKFHRLTAIKDENTRDKRWLFQCDCGNMVSVPRARVFSGETKSCGCLRIEKSKERMMSDPIFNATTHGKSDTRLYTIWKNMRRRCSDKKNTGYHNYGGRGIKVCDEWQDFMKFYSWAVSNGYKSNLSIDRIDNNGNYEPNNCQWVTVERQANNKRTNTMVTINGETHSLADWSRIKNINYKMVCTRIGKLHWTPYDAIVTPKRQRKDVN